MMTPPPDAGLRSTGLPLGSSWGLAFMPSTCAACSGACVLCVFEMGWGAWWVGGERQTHTIFRGPWLNLLVFLGDKGERKTAFSFSHPLFCDANYTKVLRKRNII